MTTQKEFKKQVYLHFRHHRKCLGITQQKAADILGIGRTSITNIESGFQTINAHDYLFFISLTNSDVKTLLGNNL